MLFNPALATATEAERNLEVLLDDDRFGTKAMLPAQECGQYATISGTKFVLYNGGQTVCGKLFAINQKA